MTSSAGGSSAASTPADAGVQSEQTPGAVLEAERVRQGWSVQQAAEALHLDPWIIEAIESNRFAALGAPVYAKGHLKKYATLLGVAPSDVITCYQRLTDTLPEPTPIPNITTTPPPRSSWPKVFGWTLLLAVVVALGFGAYVVVTPMVEQQTMDAPPVMALPSGEAAVTSELVMPVSEAEAQPTDAANESAPVEASEAPQTLAAETTPAASVTEPSAVIAPSTVREATSPTATASNIVRLQLTFNDASWVEAYDASGQRLLYDIGRPGRTRMVEGAPPLTVVLGVAAAVQVQVNDQAIVVPRRANRDATRFVVNADGSVQ